MHIKRLISILAVGGVLAVVLAVTGCSKAEEAPDVKAEPVAKPGSIPPPSDLPEGLKGGKKGSSPGK